MLVIIVMPEVLIGKALGDYFAARRFISCEGMQKYPKWRTKTHAFYANMGGFILGEVPERNLSDMENKPPVIESELSDTEGEKRRERYLYLRHTHPEEWDHSDEEEVKLPIAINSAQLCMLLNKGYISTQPPITEDEINDKSKGDAFAKGSALVQVVWLIIELITRKARGLPSTQLEIVALPFAVCTMFTYCLWFGKPQNAEVPTYIFPTTDLSVDSHDAIKIRKILAWQTSDRFFRETLGGYDERYSPSEIIPNDMFNKEAGIWNWQNSVTNTDWDISGEDFGFILGAIVLGVCHCVAWNFEFPTLIERTIWRVASAAVTGIMPIYYFVLLLEGQLLNSRRKLRIVFGSIIPWTCFGLYIILRLYLIAEAFRDLFYLPSGAFVATWSSSIPHVA